MWIWRITVLIALAMLLPTEGMGQPPRRGGPGRNPFFDAMREAFQEDTHRELFELLYHPPVREHVGLNREDFDQIRDYMKDSMQAIHQLADDSRNSSKSKDELKAEILERTAPFHESAVRLLREKADLERLVQLFVQARGFSSAANGEVAERIELQGEELAKFREARAKLKHRLMNETRREIEKLIHNPPQDVRERIKKLFEKANEKLDAEIAEHLTDPQKTALETLKGEPFDGLPKRGGDPRHGGGGRGFDRSRPPPHKDPPPREGCPDHPDAHCDCQR